MSVLLHTLIPPCIIVVEGAFSILLPFFNRFRVLFIGALLLKSVVREKKVFNTLHEAVVIVW